MATVAHAADGGLDPGFGVNGQVLTPPFNISGNANTEGYAMARQTDGKLLVASTADGHNLFGQFAVTRINVNGTVDTAFGRNGTAYAIIGILSDEPYALIVQSDGKIVAAGSSKMGTGGNHQFGLARFNSDGSLDSGFGDGGRVTTLFAGGGSSGDDSVINGLVQQDDGKLVAAGYARIGGSNDVALARYNTDGSLDPSFGVAGRVLTPILTNELGRALVQQADGKLVVAGSTYGNIGGVAIYDAFVARYDRNGNLDPGFGSGGIVRTNLGEDTDAFYALAVAPDGKLIAAGGARTFALARFNIDGSLDPSFAGDGLLVEPLATSFQWAATVALQTDGRIVVGGSMSDAFSLARYNSDGSLDTTFDGDGKVSTTVSSAEGVHGLLQQPDGKLVAAGLTRLANAGSTFNAALVRYNANGSLDTTFDADGKVTIGATYGTDEATALTRQADGKLVAVGTTSNAGSLPFAVARYNADGSLDASFGSGGRVTTSIGTGASAEAAIQQADGKIVVVGSTGGASNTMDFALVRYTASGALDSTFGTGGKVITDLNGTTEYGYAVVQTANGKLVVAGTASRSGSGYDFALARYNANGTLDTTFGTGGKVFTAVSTSSDQARVLVQQPDGKLIAAGYAAVGTDEDVAVVRYNPDGSLDSTFDGDGKLTTHFPGRWSRATAAILQADGKLVVSSGNGLFQIARYLADGSLDPSFDGDGLVQIFSFACHLYGIRQQSDGKLIAAGSSVTTSNRDVFTFLRFASNGSLDSTFGSLGMALHPIGTRNAVANAAVLQPDGRLVAAGFAVDVSGNQVFALARIDTVAPPTPTPTSTPIPTNTATVTSTSSPSPTPTETMTPQPTPSATMTAVVTATSTPTFSSSPTSTGTATPTSTTTNTPTSSATATPSPTSSPSHTSTPTSTSSPTESPTQTATLTETSTTTPTSTATATQSPTSTPTSTSSPTESPLPTATQTPSLTATRTATQTPSPTPTLTPTATAPMPTASPSPANTPTSSETPTPTATPTPQTNCRAESPASSCAPGGGSRRTDCILEFDSRPVPLRNGAGVPRSRASCSEDDPACDSDSRLNDGVCVFAVRLCINNADPRLSACVPSAVDSIEVKRPRASFGDAADAANLAALKAQAGSPLGFGLTVLDSDGDVNLGAPNASGDLCGAPLPIVVPLRTNGRGLQLRAHRTIQLVSRIGGIADRDKLTLECLPGTCGNGRVETDHEQCDDGNRIDGDGCSSRCQREQ